VADGQARRFLVVRTDRIGDVLLSTPVLESLRMSFPNAHIAMMVSQVTVPLVRDNPHLGDVLVDSQAGPGGFFRTLRTVRRGRYTHALLLHPTFRLALLLFAARIPVRIGTAYRVYSFLFNRRVREHRSLCDRHEAAYNLSLAEAAGARRTELRPLLSVQQEYRSAIEYRLEGLGVAPGVPFVAVHPGSGGSSRNWSSQQYARLVGAGRQAWGVELVVTGGPGEEKLVAQVASQVSVHPPVTADCLSLGELAALLERAQFLVSGSTGPMHIASAVGTPVIGLFCPIEGCTPRRWGPLGKGDVVLMPPVPPCRRCIGHSCPYYDCMDQISVEDVIQAGREILDPPSPF
jgi:heptosyltransferase-3